MAKAGGCALAVFMLVWSAFTLAFDIYMVRRITRQARTYNYSVAQGKIVSSSLKVNSDSDGTTYGVNVSYQYSIRGRDHTSQQYRYDDMSASDDSAQKIVNTLPAGATVPVYYDPANPSDAVLQQGLDGTDLFIPLFMAPFNCIMFGGWWGVLCYLVDRSKRPAAGLRIIHTGAAVHLRMPEAAPLAVGVAALGGAAFVAIFVCAFAIGFGGPIWQYALAWAVVLSFAVFCAGRVWLKQLAGDSDLIIDDLRGTISLPLTCGRKHRIEFKRAALAGVDIITTIKPDDESPTTEYAPSLVWQENGERRKESLIKWTDAARAEALTDWLRTQLKTGKPQAEQPVG